MNTLLRIVGWGSAVYPVCYLVDHFSWHLVAFAACVIVFAASAVLAGALDL